MPKRFARENNQQATRLYKRGFTSRYTFTINQEMLQNVTSLMDQFHLESFQLITKVYRQSGAGDFFFRPRKSAINKMLFEQERNFKLKSSSLWVKV